MSTALGLGAIVLAAPLKLTAEIEPIRRAARYPSFPVLNRVPGGGICELVPFPITTQSISYFVVRFRDPGNVL